MRGSSGLKWMTLRDPIQIDYDYNFVDSGSGPLEKLFEFRGETYPLDKVSQITGTSQAQLKRLGMNGTMFPEKDPKASSRDRKDYFIRRVQ